MDLDQLKQIDLAGGMRLSEFEIEHEGLRLKIRKDVAGVAAAVSAAGTAPSIVASPAAGSASSLFRGAVHGTPSHQTGDAEIELAVVKSPIVGTFYRSPEPGAPRLSTSARPSRRGRCCASSKR